MSQEIVREYEVGEFRGSFPDVPTAAGVDMEALKAGDADPMLVTLPIVPAFGAVSRNGLLYDAQLIDSIVAQINDKRPDGIFGHLKDEDRSTAFPEPAVHWVGATVADGKAWAKGYIPPGAARDRVKRLKATGGQIATSIYGKGSYEPTATKGVRRLASFDLESLDFAPPARAALGNGAYPHVTAELAQENPDIMDKAQIIAELTLSDIPAAIRDQIVAEAQQRSTATQTIAELQQAVADRDTLLQTAQQTVAEYQRQRFSDSLDTRVADLTNWSVKGEEAQKKLDSFRRTLRARITQELGEERDAERVAETVTAVWADLEPLAETLRDSLAGPAAVVGGKGKGNDNWRDELVKNAKELRVAAGI